MTTRGTQQADTTIDPCAPTDDTDGVAVVLFDATGRIVRSDPLASQLLQLNDEALKGRRLSSEGWNLVDADGVRFECRINPIWNVLVSGLPVIGVIVGVLCADGSRSWLRMSATPVLDHAGEPRAVIASLSEFDRSGECDTPHPSAHFPGSFEYSLTAHLVVDRGGRVIDWNRRLLEMTGLSEFDLANGTLDDVCNVAADWLWSALGDVESAPVEGHTWVSRVGMSDLEVFGSFRLVDRPLVGRVVVVQLLDPGSFARPSRPSRPPGRAVGRAAFDNAVMAMLLVSTEGEIIESNSAAAALLGRSAQELVQEPFGRHIVGVDSAEWERVTVEALRVSSPVILTHRLVAPSDSPPLDVDVRVSCMTDCGTRRVLLVQLLPRSYGRQDPESHERSTQKVLDRSSLLRLRRRKPVASSGADLCGMTSEQALASLGS